MSNSSLVTYTNISPNKTSPRNHAIDTVTIHCMAGNLTIERCGKRFAKRITAASSNYGIGSDGRIGLYVEEKDRSWASSNKANDMRAITIEVANDGGEETGWHVSEKAMVSLINLLVDICKRNNIKGLKWSDNKTDRVNHRNGCNMTVHRDYKKKSCPGNYLYGKHAYIAEEVNKRLGISITQETYGKSQFIKDIQAAVNVTMDGIVGPKTLAALPTVSCKTNRKHAVVKPLQCYLNQLGYFCGDADGVAGSKFDAAAKAWAKANGCVADGEFTAGGESWKRILGVV